jgi:hypothetical protein
MVMGRYDEATGRLVETSKLTGKDMGEYIQKSGDVFKEAAKAGVKEDTLLARQTARATTDIAKVMEQGIEMWLERIFGVVRAISVWVNDEEDERAAQAEAMAKTDAIIDANQQEIADKQKELTQLQGRLKEKGLGADERADVEAKIKKAELDINRASGVIQTTMKQQEHIHQTALKGKFLGLGSSRSAEEFIEKGQSAEETKKARDKAIDEMYGEGAAKKLAEAAKAKAPEVLAGMLSKLGVGEVSSEAEYVQKMSTIAQGPQDTPEFHKLRTQAMAVYKAQGRGGDIGELFGEDAGAAISEIMRFRAMGAARQAAPEKVVESAKWGALGVDKTAVKSKAAQDYFAAEQHDVATYKGRFGKYRMGRNIEGAWEGQVNKAMGGAEGIRGILRAQEVAQEKAAARRALPQYGVGKGMKHLALGMTIGGEAGATRGRGVGAERPEIKEMRRIASLNDELLKKEVEAKAEDKKAHDLSREFFRDLLSNSDPDKLRDALKEQADEISKASVRSSMLQAGIAGTTGEYERFMAALGEGKAPKGRLAEAVKAAVKAKTLDLGPLTGKAGDAMTKLLARKAQPAAEDFVMQVGSGGVKFAQRVDPGDVGVFAKPGGALSKAGGGRGTTVNHVYGSMSSHLSAHETIRKTLMGRT